MTAEKPSPYRCKDKQRLVFTERLDAGNQMYVSIHHSYEKDHFVIFDDDIPELMKYCAGHSTLQQEPAPEPFPRCCRVNGDKADCEFMIWTSADSPTFCTRNISTKHDAAIRNKVLKEIEEKLRDGGCPEEYAPNYMGCGNCPFFIIYDEEIECAIKTLRGKSDD